MLPIPPTAVIVGVLLFMMRSSLGGIILGSLLTLIALHLWPDMMAMPYEWVGSLIESTGLRALVENTEGPTTP